MLFFGALRGIVVRHCGRIGARFSGYDGDMLDEILSIAKGTFGFEAFLVITTGTSAGWEDLFG